MKSYTSNSNEESNEPGYDEDQDQYAEHKDMLANCKMVLEEGGGHIAINPVFDKMITSLRTAGDIDGKLYHTMIYLTHLDLL